MRAAGFLKSWSMKDGYATIEKVHYIMKTCRKLKIAANNQNIAIIIAFKL